ncbi:MAG TPA: GNAT family protein [Actinocrinis sp.]|nr:GNAT family protein [Actinocrinis sp.]
MTEHIWLRPLTETDLGLAEVLYEDPAEAGQYGFFGYFPGVLRRNWAEDRLIGSDHGNLAIVRGTRAGGAGGAGGVFVGEVGWYKEKCGPTSFCWSIGIGLLNVERGKGYGTEAQRQIAAYLFAHTQFNRIEASTESTNTAEQRSLEKAGFTREGIRRGALFRAGTWRDLVVYSVLRSEVTLPD